MKKNTFSLVALFIISSILLSGCGNYRELDRLTIIAGMAIDKNEQGKYMITVEVVNVSGGKETKIQSKLIEIYGDTIVDTTRNLVNIVSPKPFWGQMQIVIISQEVAQEGIIDILDTMNRNRETRTTIDLLVSKEKTAKEILESQILTAEIRSYEIKRMLDEQMIYLSKTYKAKIYEFVNALSGEGISPVLPAVQITQNQGERIAELSGSAVFDKDKLIGFLDSNESKSLLFIRNKIKSGVLVLKEPRGSGHANLTLVIKDNKTKVKPVYSNEKVSIDIHIKTIVDLREYGVIEKMLDEKKILALEHKAEEKLKGNIENFIRKVQEDYNVDVFGFGSIIYQDMPWLWKEIKPDWNNVFGNLDVNVSVNIETRNTGLLSEPIKVGD
jgi:spore germination protein KC